jgi:nucleoid DNA-binding protein
MTKHELAKQVGADTGLTGEQARNAVDAAFDAIAGELVAGRDVAIAGFGKFSVGERAAREGQPRDRRDDPDRRQPRREVLRSRRPEEAAQQLTAAGPPGRVPTAGVGRRR